MQRPQLGKVSQAAMLDILKTLTGRIVALTSGTQGLSPRMAVKKSVINSEFNSVICSTHGADMLHPASPMSFGY